MNQPKKGVAAQIEHSTANFSDGDERHLSSVALTLSFCGQVLG